MRTIAIAISVLCVLVLVVLVFWLRKRGGHPTLEDQKPGTVRIEFVNGRDQCVLATSDVPLTQLPESFRIDTSVEVNGRKWSVSSADPTEKVDFAKTGHLRVVLAEIKQLPPGDLLFSLATISNDCGRVVGRVLPHDGLFQIHEDDWRQVEFVSNSYRGAVDQELKDIRAIYENERVGVGFRRVHVRKRIPEPLSGVSLRLEELRIYLPPKSSYEAVSFTRTPGTVPGSFAWKTILGPVVWGLADKDGSVALLCLAGRQNEARRTGEVLSKLAGEKGLLLVDWCRVKAIGGSADIFQEYLDKAE
jgi:hypothetical protein